MQLNIQLYWPILVESRQNNNKPDDTKVLGGKKHNLSYLLVFSISKPLMMHQGFP